MNNNQIYAEDMAYWDTDVHPASSQGDITAQLEEFGAENVDFRVLSAKGDFGWIIRFTYREKKYRWLFKPLPCRYPNKERSLGRGKGFRPYPEQAKFQMGRRAFYLVKAILNVAAEDSDLLVGKQELEGSTGGPLGLPLTIGELDLPNLLGGLKQLPATIQPNIIVEKE